MLNLPEFVIFCTSSGTLLLWYCHIRIACFHFQGYFSFFCFPLCFEYVGYLKSVFSALQNCSLTLFTLSLCSLTPVFIVLLSSPRLLSLSFTSAPPHLLTSLISTLTLSGGGESWAGPGPRPISPSLAAMCSSPEIITPSQWHHSNASLMID